MSNPVPSQQTFFHPRYGLGTVARCERGGNVFHIQALLAFLTEIMRKYGRGLHRIENDQSRAGLVMHEIAQMFNGHGVRLSANGDTLFLKGHRLCPDFRLDEIRNLAPLTLLKKAGAIPEARQRARGQHKLAAPILA